MIKAIVAVDKNFAIGKNGGLAWHYREDLQFFKRQTTNHAVVMGRRTFESIGKPLPHRLNIVLTSSKFIEPHPNLILMPDVASVLKLEKYLRVNLFIIGGAQIYKAFAAHIERWLVTEIPLVVEDADTFMNRDFLDGFAFADKTILSDDLQVKQYVRGAPTYPPQNLVCL